MTLYQLSIALTINGISINLIFINAFVRAESHRCESQKHCPIWPQRVFFDNLKGPPSGQNSFLNPQRAGYAGAAEAAVAVGVLAEVLLVVVFRVVEGLALADVGGDGAKAMLGKHLLVVLAELRAASICLAEVG